MILAQGASARLGLGMGGWDVVSDAALKVGLGAGACRWLRISAADEAILVFWGDIGSCFLC